MTNEETTERISALELTVERLLSRLANAREPIDVNIAAGITLQELAGVSEEVAEK